MVSSRIRRLLLDALWGFGAAALVVVVIALSEAFKIRWAASWPRVVAGIGYYGAIVGLAGVMLVVLSTPIRVRVTKWSQRWFAADGLYAERRLAWAPGLAILALGMPRVAARVAGLEESARGVMWLVVVVLAGIALLFAVGLVARVYAALRRRIPLSWHPAVHHLIFIFTIFGVAFFLRRDAARLVELLGWTDFAAAVLVIGGALLGPALGGGRAFRIAAIPAAVAVLAAGAWHVATPLDRADAAMIHQRTYVLGQAMRRLGQRAVYAGPSDGGRSCWPGEEPVMDVGRVGEEAPDILLVMADGVRFDFTSMGGERRLTPNLERWGRQAAVFTRAYTAAPSTRQSFRSLFTGLYPGVVASPPPARGAPWGVTIAPEQQTMAGYLQRAGYATTALVSKPDAFPRQGGALRGFDEIDESAYSFIRRRRYSASYVVNRILGAWADTHQAGEPRFLWTHIMEPHYPYLRPRSVGPTSRIGERQRYEWSLRYLDQELDRLLRWARSPERREHTWVIFTSDHGEGWWEHENRRHGRTAFEEEIHVPLMVWGPDVESATYEEPTSLIDVLPTILDIAGLDVPASLCGQSILAQLLTGEVETRPVLVSALPDATRDYHHLAWIQGNDKLIVDGQTGLSSFYDLEEDPEEQSDLAGEEPERTEESLDALRTFLRERGMRLATYGVPNAEDT